MDVVIAHGRRIVSDEVRALTEEKVGQAGPPVPGPRTGRGPPLRGAQPEDRRPRVCEVIITGHGHTVRARAAAPDPLVAVDLVVDKLEHQVERIKGKLVGRSHPRRRPAQLGLRPAREGAHRLTGGAVRGAAGRRRPPGRCGTGSVTSATAPTVD